jgi:hypothetical protein
MCAVLWTGCARQHRFPRVDYQWSGVPGAGADIQSLPVGGLATWVDAERECASAVAGGRLPNEAEWNTLQSHNFSDVKMPTEREWFKTDKGTPGTYSAAAQSFYFDPLPPETKVAFRCVRPRHVTLLEMIKHAISRVHG